MLLNHLAVANSSHPQQLIKSLTLNIMITEKENITKTLQIHFLGGYQWYCWQEELLHHLGCKKTHSKFCNKLHNLNWWSLDFWLPSTVSSIFILLRSHVSRHLRLWKARLLGTAWPCGGSRCRCRPSFPGRFRSGEGGGYHACFWTHTAVSSSQGEMVVLSRKLI